MLGYLTLLERASLGEGEEESSRWCIMRRAWVRLVARACWICAAMLEALELMLSILSASVRLPPSGLVCFKEAEAESPWATHTYNQVMF